MDMINQVLDRMQSAVNAAQAPQSRAGQSQNDKKGGFDAMVRQKRQELGGKDGKKAETAKPGEVREEAPAEEQAPTAEQTAMAAALLLQAQPNVRFAEVQPEARQIAAEPVLAAEPAAEVLTAAVTEELPQQTETLAGTPDRTVAEPDAALPETELQPVTADAAQAPETAPAEQLPEVTERTGPERVDRAPVEARRTEETEDAPEENLPVETPVFVRSEAVPVKVAEPVASAPLPLEAEDGVRQLAARIEDLVTDEAGNTRVQLTLTPENLGTVTVQITHSANGALHVELSATTQRAANLLERNMDGLQNLLRTETRPAVQVQVRGGEEAQQQFLNPDGQQQQNQQQPQQDQRQPRQGSDRAQDFLQQLRLGLVDTDEIL